MSCAKIQNAYLVTIQIQHKNFHLFELCIENLWWNGPMYYKCLIRNVPGNKTPTNTCNLKHINSLKPKQTLLLIKDWKVKFQWYLYNGVYLRYYGVYLSIPTSQITLKTMSHLNVNFVIIGGTSRHNHILQWYQWWQICHHGNSQF